MNHVAIIGMAGRFPGAADTARFWSNLCAGTESIRRLDAAELRRAGVPDGLLRNPAYVRVAADLDGIEDFDAAFFGLTPAEATVTDPQQRLLFELAWEALEDGCHPPEGFAGSIGVFVGASSNDYAQRVVAAGGHLEALGAFAIQIANSRDFLATRLSYALDLRGPSVTVQTACSTSLVAVHTACQSLLSGECDMALAGGASIRLPQAQGYVHVEGGVASPDGRCRAFDERAAGTVAGNGGALVLLRRLEDAVADGDFVHAVIRGTAVNNDGAQKVGFTAPSLEGQAAVIEEALAVAELGSDTIGYVEAHGTATPLGDPVEIAALREAFARCEAAPRKERCAIGALKPNVGHLDAAAGIAGLVKAACVVRTGQIPAVLHFERPNPRLRIHETPFRIGAETSEWGSLPVPRRAGVSSFGIGGTNAHVVLEEPPPVAAGAEPDEPQVLVLSAKSPAATAAATKRLAEHLRANPELSLADVAWSLQVGRKGFAHRASVAARDLAEAIELLEAEPRVADATAPRAAAFLFPGQGAQFAGMGRGLAGEAVFARELRRCLELFERAGVAGLAAALAPLASDRTTDPLTPTELAQPALFAIEYALARQWMAFGVRPAAMLGHSLGEYVAAALAGVFSLEDAARVVAERGRLMASMPEGAMTAVSLAEADLRERMSTELDLASVNGPELCVASGPLGAIEQLERALGREGVAYKRLRTSHAFHSALMEPAADALGEVLRTVTLNAPATPFASNVTGEWITAEQATDAGYWATQLRRTVRLDAGLRTLASAGPHQRIEVGPGRGFAGTARGELVLPSLARRDAHDEDASLLLRRSVGRAWSAGVAVDWPALHGDVPRRRVPLPAYPFQRRRHWVDARPDPPNETRPEPPSKAHVPDDDSRTVAGSIFGSVLGVQAVAPDDDFWDLGGSSLAAIQVVNGIRERFAVPFTMTDMLEATTPRQVAARIERLASSARAMSDRSPLVELGGTGDTGATPVFCVHGIDGEASAFSALGRALAPCPLVALRAAGLEPGEEPLDSVEALAARYTEAIRARQPKGPYFVAGHSFGGLVAFEIARRLEADGERVGRLTLIDSWLPDDGTPPLDDDAVRGEAQRLLEEHGTAYGAEELERRLAVVRAHHRAALAFRPGTFAGAALLLLARERSPGAPPDPAGPWRACLDGRLETRTVPGDHFTLLRPPHVDHVARALTPHEAIPSGARR